MLADVDNDIRMPIGAPLTVDMQSRVSTAVWSPQGRWTAWSVDSDYADGIRQVRLHNEDSNQASALVESVSAFYLCPSPCGRWLSHLSPGPLGLELAVSDVTSGAIHVIDRGQPLFWSWSPDATHLAVHVENRVLISDRAGDSIRLLSDDAGPFVTPLWLPGGSVLYALDDRIVAAGPDDVIVTLVGADSTGRFSLDPECRRLAYISTEGDSTTLVILDLVSLTPIKVTSAPVVAFFWSPDGSHLAALAALGNGIVQWLVIDGSDTRSLPPFRPTPRWPARSFSSSNNTPRAIPSGPTNRLPWLRQPSTTRAGPALPSIRSNRPVTPSGSPMQNSFGGRNRRSLTGFVRFMVGQGKPTPATLT